MHFKFNMQIIGENQLQKRDVAILNGCASGKKKYSNCGSDWLKRQHSGLHSVFQYSEPKRFVRRCNKVERNYTEKQKPN